MLWNNLSYEAKTAQSLSDFKHKLASSPRQGTKGAPNWALKQRHCNKFPDGDPSDYLTLTKLNNTATVNTRF